MLSVSLAIVLACYGLFAYLTLDRRSDRDRIESMIKDTVEAINQRDLGGTVACLSEDYSDAEGMNRDRLRMLVAQAFRAQPDYVAMAELGNVDLRGSRAAVELHAVVKNKLGEPIYDRNIILRLDKQKSRHAWILSTHVWRVARVENLGLASQL
jgi:hypothetical protein